MKVMPLTDHYSYSNLTRGKIYEAEDLVTYDGDLEYYIVVNNVSLQVYLPQPAVQVVDPPKI